MNKVLLFELILQFNFIFSFQDIYAQWEESGYLMEAE
jgi:hypothetical protein